MTNLLRFIRLYFCESIQSEVVSNIIYNQRHWAGNNFFTVNCHESWDISENPHAAKTYNVTCWANRTIDRIKLNFLSLINHGWFNDFVVIMRKSKRKLQFCFSCQPDRRSQNLLNYQEQENSVLIKFINSVSKITYTVRTSLLNH